MQDNGSENQNPQMQTAGEPTTTPAVEPQPQTPANVPNEAPPVAQQPQTPQQSEPIPPVDEPPQAPVQEVPQNSKPASGLLSIILGLFIIAIVGGVGFYLYQSGFVKNLLSSPTPQPTTASVPTPAPTESPTLGWKSFTGEIIPISFKYPPSYSMPEEKDVRGGDMITIASPLNPDREDIAILENGELKIEISREPKTGKDTPTDCWADYTKNSSLYKTTGAKDVKILGMTYETILWEKEETGEFTCFVKGDYRYLVNKYPDVTSRKDEFETILSTLEVIETVEKETSTPSATPEL